jgi:LysR family transcriptional regulator (chromosome initiation inhibitor)
LKHLALLGARIDLILPGRALCWTNIRNWHVHRTRLAVDEHGTGDVVLVGQKRPDDQEHTAERLRSGEVLAAVTAESEPPHGCKRLPIGAIEYVAVAAPSFVSRHFRAGMTPEVMSRATCIVFDRKDTLPRQWLMNALEISVTPLSHWVPSFSGYIQCCLNGAGWGIHPRLSVSEHIRDGSLVELVPGTGVTTPLYWQSSAPGSEIMKLLSIIVGDVARRHLLMQHAPQASAG